MAAIGAFPSGSFEDWVDSEDIEAQRGVSEAHYRGEEIDTRDNYRGGGGGDDVVIDGIRSDASFSFKGKSGEWFDFLGVPSGLQVNARLKTAGTLYVDDIRREGHGALRDERGRLRLSKLLDLKRLGGTVMTELNVRVGGVTLEIGSGQPLRPPKQPLVDGRPLGPGEVFSTSDGTEITLDDQGIVHVESPDVSFQVHRTGNRFVNIRQVETNRTDLSGVIGETSRGDTKTDLRPGGQGEGNLLKPWQAYMLG